MKIPKRFKMFGQTIDIEYDKTLTHRTDNIGVASSIRNKITLQSNIEGHPMPRQKMEETFLHEKVHLILNFMRHDLSSNEAFVEIFSGLLHQSIVTEE